MMAFRSPPGNSRKGKGGGKKEAIGAILGLGRETATIDEALTSIGLAIAVVGGGIAACAVVLIGFVVNRGMKPLHDLASQTATIDADSLDARFSLEGAPGELRPVIGHLNELIERLEAGFERERRFGADLAHEMRTPVAELKLMNEVALEWEDQAGERVHRDSVAIAERLGSTIESLLALTRFETGDVPVRRQQIDAFALARDCWEEVSRAAEERQVTVRFEESDPVIFYADEELLRRVFGNLLSNAVAYAPPGDAVAISSGREGEIRFSNGAPNLDADDVSRMFERYWRADSSRSSSSHAGLGLAIARACAETCGMELGAALKDGRIEFTVRRQDPTGRA